MGGGGGGGGTVYTQNDSLALSQPHTEYHVLLDLLFFETHFF